MFPKTIDFDLPRTVDEAVTILLADLPLLERSLLANLTFEELDLINHIVGLQIAKDFFMERQRCAAASLYDRYRDN